MLVARARRASYARRVRVWGHRFVLKGGTLPYTVNYVEPSYFALGSEVVGGR